MIVYQIGVEVSNKIYILNSMTSYQESLFYLPPGITLAFLVLFGTEYFPFLLFNPIINTYLNGRPWYVITFLPIFITIVYGSAAYVLKNILQYEPSQFTVSNLTKFTVIAVFFPFILAVMVNVMLLSFQHNLIWSVFWERLPNWYVGDLIGIFTIYPIALALYLNYQKYGFRGSFTHFHTKGIGYFLFINIVVMIVYALLFYDKLNLLFILILPVIIIAIYEDAKYTLLASSYISLEFSYLLSLDSGSILVIEMQAFIFIIVLTALYFAAFRYENSRLQDILIADQVKLLESSKYTTIGKLSQGVSHDVKNVLSSALLLLDYLELEEKENLEETEIRQLRSILDISNNLVSRLQLLSTFTEVEKTEIIIDEAIKNSKSTLSNLVKKDVIINYDLKAVNYKILANPSQIEQLVLNLVVNANEGIHETGEITISTNHVQHGTKDSILIEIRDSGVGMSTEVQAKIFDMLYTTKEGNSGLGLWIVSEIVDSLDGEIKLKSEVGKGTSFSIYLPCI